MNDIFGGYTPSPCRINNAGTGCQNPAPALLIVILFSTQINLSVISFSLHPTSPNKTNTQRLRNSALFKFIIPFQGHMLFSSHPHDQPLYLQHQFHRHRPCLSRKPFQNSLPSLADHCSFFKCTFIILSGSCNHINISE